VFSFFALVSNINRIFVNLLRVGFVTGVLKEFYRGEPMRMSDWSHYSELLCPKCTQHCMNIVHIKSGFKGTHIVSDGEMHIMERDFERDEIVSMYMPKGTMSQEELERVVYHLPPRLRHQHIYTQDEIIDMFAKCQKAPSGAYVFQNFVEYDLFCLFDSVCFYVC
jgi:hypothetical protein